MEIVNISYQYLCSYGINKYMINNNWYWWKATGFIIWSYGRYRNHWSSVGYISNHIVVLIFMKIIVVLEYHIIVSIWKPVAFCYSYKKYIDIAERNEHSKVELIIISFNRDIIIVFMCTKNYDQMMHGSWDMVCDGKSDI